MKLDIMDLYWTYILGYMTGIYFVLSLRLNDDYLTWFPVFFAAIPCVATLAMSFKFSHNSSVWLPRLFLIFSILLLYLWNTISWRPFFMVSRKLSSITKNRVYLPLIIDYGRNAEEIKRVMHIEDLNIPSQPVTFRELWYCLTHDKNSFQRVCSSIFGGLPGSIAESYDLLWLMMISDNPHGNRLTKSQLHSIAGASNKQLRSLLPRHFSDNNDRVSLLFSLMSGSVVETQRGSRYSKISKYSPELVYNLTIEQLISDEQGRYETSGPYSYLSQTEESGVESLLQNIKSDNADLLAQKWGITLPSGEDKVSYLRSELSSYQEVFKRKDKPEYPNIRGINRSEAEKLLLKFTNRELQDYYEPRRAWSNRKELIKVIYDDVNGDPYWSLTSLGHCNNDDTINILTAELHGDMNKYDLEDPTLSYGNYKNYRCYQMSELVGSFAEREGVFRFSLPDYTPGSTLPLEFPIESIRQLKKILEDTKSPVYRPLLEQIKIGFNTMSDAKQRILIMKQRFQTFPVEQQEIVKLYFAWMFCYGMWMRFWEGPGYPWPVRKVGNLDPRIRDAHIIIQNLVRTKIMEKYQGFPGLKQWIEDSPVISIDLTSNEPPFCASRTIISEFEEIANGIKCMGFGADTIVKTAYYYITEMLDYSEGKKFNDFIQYQIPFLLELEQSAIDTIKWDDPYVEVAVQKRLNDIQRGFDNQPGFTSYQFQNNRHTADRVF